MRYIVQGTDWADIAVCHVEAESKEKAIQQFDKQFPETFAKGWFGPVAEEVGQSNFKKGFAFYGKRM